MKHHLKIYPEYFKAVKWGYKKAEVRLNDRNFQVGDTLILQEYNPLNNSYTGDETEKEVTHILSGLSSDFGIKPNYVVMSIK